MTSLDIAIIAAGASFGAAIAGAATGGLSSYRLQRRQERALARGGARLVRQDFEAAARALHKVVKDHSYTSAVKPEMPSWEEHRSVIASNLCADTWTLVASAVDELAVLAAAFGGKPGADLRCVIDAPQIAAVKKLRDRVIQAHNALTVLAHDERQLRPALLDETIERAGAAGAPQ